MTSAEATQILYRALAEPIGLLLRTSSPVQAKTRFYAARAKAKDAALAGLQIRASPIEGGDLILVKGTIQIGQRPDPETLEDLGL